MQIERRLFINLGAAGLLGGLVGCSTNKSFFANVNWEDNSALMAFDPNVPFDIHLPRGSINFVTVPVPQCIDESLLFPPLPEDSKADLYYRAAYKILGQRDTQHFRKMYILGKQAADMGHWRAKLLMAHIYLQRSNNYYSETRPAQARAYIDELMTQNVAAAFYEMSRCRNAGLSGFKESPAPASFYLYRSAQLGSAQAMVSISKIFMTVKRYQDAQLLFRCGIQQGEGGEAAADQAISEFLNARTREDWEYAFSLLHMAAKAGGAQGSENFFAFSFDEAKFGQANGERYLSVEFIRRAEALQRACDPQWWHDDIWRKRQGQPYRVKGSVHLKFPNLDNIIPLPPSVLPDWDGDISAGMDEDGRREYRTDYDYAALVREIS